MRYFAILFLFSLTTCKGQVARKSSDKYENVAEQVDTLKKYYEKATNSVGDTKEKYEQLFFEAFPSSFRRMEEIYGFDNEKGEAPLYAEGENYINLFYKIKYVDVTDYYNKYINISIDGKWEGDNIAEGFGIYGKIYDDTERMLNLLSIRAEKEIRSVFRFVFDGPHPDKRKEDFENLFLIVQKTNPSMAELMKQEYEKLLKESDGHGR